MEDKFYSVEEISKMLNMHVKTIQRYIREGKLRATKIGKAWRINGHDLSQFVEGNSKEAIELSQDHTNSYRRIKISSVVDIDGIDNDQAMRIIDGLNAALNNKPAEYGDSQMNAQYLPREAALRIMLWGDIRFMEAVTVFLQGYMDTGEGEENEEPSNL